MKKIIMGTSLGLALLFTGCATIIDGKTQKIELESEKKQTVRINNQEFSSPGIIELERVDADAVVKTIECNQILILKKELNPLFIGNIVAGGSFGSTTDISTGAAWRYAPNKLNVGCD